MFDTVLVANRGEIARRIIRTLERMDVKAVAVFADGDARLPYVREADEAVQLGRSSTTIAYLDQAALVEAARTAGARAIHPGYGFLAENAEFARSVLANGMAWIGPQPEVIASMADKAFARRVVARVGVPVLAASTALEDPDEAVAQAAHLEYPVLIKPVAGGGGGGIAVAEDEDQLRSAVANAVTQATERFGVGAVMIERYVRRARHVEVQVLGLRDGRVVALGERDASVQRRWRKVIEEGPSPGVDPDLRAQLMDSAVAAAEAIGYRNAGTVEFILDLDRPGSYFFLELDSRLQVGHPLTEELTGVDLVEEQLRIAAGQEVTFGDGPVDVRGHAIALRIYAEDPDSFAPSQGVISTWREPVGEGVRIDAGYDVGDEVTGRHDPLIAKLIVSAGDRATALARTKEALASFEIEGVTTNRPFLARLLDDPAFVSGEYDTGLVSRLQPT